MDLAKVSDDGTRPPRISLPTEETFLATYQTGTKQYLSRFDEALYDNFSNSVRMLLDPCIVDPLRVRQRAVLSTAWHIEADDDEDDFQVQAAANIEKRIKRMPQLAAFLLSLKQDIWYGRAGAQILYKWQKVDGVWGISPIGSIPVNGDKLTFFYSGEVGIRVNALYKGSTVVTDYNMVHKLDAAERESFVVGMFEPEDADYRQPWFAGAIKGLGLRHRLYWWWSLKNQASMYMADYLQWFARGLTIFQFDANNASAEAELQQRIQNNQDKPFLLYPRFHDGGPGYDPVVRVSADTNSAGFLLELLQYYDSQIRSMILGENLSTQGGSPGLGGEGVATATGGVAQSVKKYDCNTTQDYLTSDMVKVMYGYAYPGMPSGRWVFETDSPNVEEVKESVQLYTGLGGRVGDKWLAKTLSIPDVKEGEAALSVTPPTESPDTAGNA